MAISGVARLGNTSDLQERMLKSAAKDSRMSANEINLMQANSRPAFSAGSSANASRILNLQRTVGNQTVLRLMSAVKPASVLAPPVAGDTEEEKPVSTESGQTTTTETKTDTPQKPDPDGSAGMVVEETFRAKEFDVVPDEHMHLAPADGSVDTPHKDDGVETPHKADEEPQAPSLNFKNLGCVGTVPYDSAALDNGDRRPHAFTNGGQTGTVVWAGGGGAGARGNEGAGSIQNQVAPVYQSRANKDSKDADAWVQAGTGKVDVTRSFVGVRSGDQGNGHFVTAAAATRLNQHETQHVANSLGNYNTHIKPMLDRVADHSLGLNIAATEAAAINALKAVIKYPEAITAFQTADLAANKPMGTVDTNDLASGTYPVDAGPGNVAGKAFQHRVRTPGEADPAPGAPPAP